MFQKYIRWECKGQLPISLTLEVLIYSINVEKNSSDSATTIWTGGYLYTAVYFPKKNIKNCSGRLLIYTNFTHLIITYVDQFLHHFIAREIIFFDFRTRNYLMWIISEKSATNTLHCVWLWLTHTSHFNMNYSKTKTKLKWYRKKKWFNFLIWRYVFLSTTQMNPLKLRVVNNVV